MNFEKDGKLIIENNTFYIAGVNEKYVIYIDKEERNNINRFSIPDIHYFIKHGYGKYVPTRKSILKEILK